MQATSYFKTEGAQMVLSLDQEITAHEIFSVQALSNGHPVWQLRGPGPSSVVVKREEVRLGGGRKEALHHNLWLMRAVDSDARVVVLTRAEVDAIGDFVQDEKTTAELLHRDVDADMQRLSDSLEHPLGKWVKMGFKQLVNLEDAGHDRIDGNKAGVRQFAAVMNAAGGLEKLGAILAADLFNDNNDRFSVEGGGGTFHGTPLQFLVNPGNVLLSSGRLSGLDSWDPTSPTRNARANLNTLDPHRKWGGHLLRPGGTVNINGRVITQEGFARGVIADLETVLGPRNRQVLGARTKRLEKGARGRLQQGMWSGAQKIRSRLRVMARKPRPLPLLLQDKAHMLGWNPL
jgi:hypothetical protein